jgi:hypothetical protein
MSFIKFLSELPKKIFVSKKLFNCILLAVLPALLFYGISIVWLNTIGFEVMEILRDPAQQSGASSFIGFLSNIGVWLWVSSAAIAFFTITCTSFQNKNLKNLIFLAGMLSIILAVDDFFLIHDRYINQKICFIVYAIFAGALLVRHYKLILQHEGFAFLLAGSLLALSIVTDSIQTRIPFPYSEVQVFEEGFKFVGAATWLYFMAKMASLPTSQTK